jgi:hypothetical protein
VSDIAWIVCGGLMVTCLCIASFTVGNKNGYEEGKTVLVENFMKGYQIIGSKGAIRFVPNEKESGKEDGDGK